MARGKRSATVNAALRSGLTDEQKRAERAERHTNALARQLAAAQERIAALENGADIAAERERHAAIERRLTDDVAAIHQHYRDLFAAAEYMVRTHWQLGDFWLVDHPDYDGAKVIDPPGVKAMREMWPAFPWAGVDRREIRRAQKYRVDELVDFSRR
jgi:hypothetical protein